MPRGRNCEAGTYRLGPRSHNAWATRSFGLARTYGKQSMEVASMLNTLRYATLGAALLAGTAVTHAQTVIMPEPAYVAPAYVAPAYPAPVVTVPAAPVIAPAPEVVVTQPAPVVVPAAPVAREIVTPAPQTVITQPQTSVQETVVRRSETRPA